MARRFVRLASTAAQKAAAARTHAPGLLKGGAGLAPTSLTASATSAARPCSCGGHGAAQGSTQNTGRWIRRGRKVVLLGI